MSNFKITSKANTSTIEILGAIGESFFTEGNTLQSVKKEIESIEDDNITVKISSLGGDAFEGLAIHDLFKSSKKNITSEIIGATASAGTIVALGGDNVKISKNALFLIHNSSTIAFGNSKDLRKTADDLDTVDNRMVAIYVSKTGKTESEVRDLMAEDKWIDATESEEFGLIDSISESKKIAASAIAPINHSEKLPKLTKIQINNLTKKNETGMKTEDKNFIEEKIQSVKDVITSFLAKGENKEEFKSVNEKFEDSIAEIQAKVDQSISENETLKKSISEKETELIKANKKLADAKIKDNNTKGNENKDPDNQSDERKTSIDAFKSLVISRRQ